MLLAAPKEKFSKYFDGDILYRHITNKSQGNLCGEVALQQGAARNASMVAMNNVKCLTIDKLTFDKFLGESAKRENEKVKFFQSKFVELSQKNVRNFICMFEVETYKKDQTIYLEGDQCTALHLVESGSVGMFSFSHTGRTFKNTFEEEENPTFRKLLTEIADFGTEHVYEYYKPIRPSEEKAVPAAKGVQISNLGPYCTFGEESLIPSQSSYLYTAVALSTPTLVFRLPKAKFNASLEIIGTFAMQNINVMGQMNNNYRQNRLKKTLDMKTKLKALQKQAAGQDNDAQTQEVPEAIIQSSFVPLICRQPLISSDDIQQPEGLVIAYAKGKLSTKRKFVPANKSAKKRLDLQTANGERHAKLKEEQPRFFGDAQLIKVNNLVVGFTKSNCLWQNPKSLFPV